MVKAATSAETFVEVEVSGPKNECLIFAPLQRRVRGRFDLLAVAEPQARMRSMEWSEPIPGQRIRIDYATGEGAIVEPLHDPTHAALSEKIARRGVRFVPPRETFAAIDLATWHFWLKRAVDSGSARVVAGAFPDEVPGEPQMSFVSKPVTSSNDRLAAALERNSDLLARVLEKLVKE